MGEDRAGYPVGVSLSGADLPLSMLLMLCPALAVDFTVAADGSGDFDKIADALDAASGGDRLLVAEGDYVAGILLAKDVDIIGSGSGSTRMFTQGAADTLEISAAVMKIEAMTIDGLGSQRPINIYGGSDVTLADVVVLGGSDGGDLQPGWGMRVAGSTVDISNSTFTDPVDATGFRGGHVALTNATLTGSAVTFSNGLASEGGAIYLAAGSVLELDESTFAFNTAQRGGAVFAKEGSTVDVESGTFADNDAFSGDGGAIRVMDGSALSVTDTLFERNTSTARGGHIAAQDADVTVAGASFTAGSAGVNGGALFVSSVGGGTVEIDASSFVGNQSTDDGGAVFLAGVGGYHIVRSDFCENLVTDDQGDGGAIHIEDSGDVDSYIAGSVFNSNDAGEAGGAVDCAENSTMKLVNNTLVGNASVVGQGALRNVTGCAALVINNVISSSSGFGARDGGDGIAEYNLFSDNVEGPTPELAFLSLTNLLDVDPMFREWTGSCEDDLRPAEGSPVIDAGDPNILDDDGSRSDIGAFGGSYGRGSETPTDPDTTDTLDTGTPDGNGSHRRVGSAVPPGWFCSGGGSSPGALLAFLGFWVAFSRRRVSCGSS